MSWSEPLVPVRHGTTRQRAEAILRNGPDPNFLEPGSWEKAKGFSTARLRGPFPLGSPEEHAAGKAALFPDEGGPAILEIEVPQSLANMADILGEVRFDRDCGLKELLAIWAVIPKRML